MESNKTKTLYSDPTYMILCIFIIIFLCRYLYLEVKVLANVILFLNQLLGKVQFVPEGLPRIPRLQRLPDMTQNQDFKARLLIKTPK